jgi:hypothetical protein
MSNPIPDRIKTGTMGELLVQLRLLQFDVQAAPPIKDSGNDLVAVRGEAFRSVQVKTTTKGQFQLPKLPKYYHILALVDLRGEDNQIYLDRSEVFLVSRAVIDKNGLPNDLAPFRLGQELVDELFNAGF